MCESPLVNGIRSNKGEIINNQAKVSDIISTAKKWHLQELKSIQAL